MTRETKVGLIVGLAFITVFAVILSHKGTQPRAAISSEMGPLVDAGSVLEKPQPSVSHAKAPQGPVKPPAVLPDTSIVSNAAATAKVAAPTNSTADNATRGVAGNNDRPLVPLPEFPRNGDASAERRDASGKTQNTWLDGTPDASEGNTLSTTLTRTAPPLAKPESPPTPEVKPTVTPEPELKQEPPPEAKPAVKQEYVAQKGDTLYRIAGKMYGSSSKKGIDAIVAANPKDLPNPNSVRAGMKLVIPELPADKFEAADFPPRGKSTQANKTDELTAKKTALTSKTEVATTDTGASPPDAAGSATLPPKPSIANRTDMTVKPEVTAKTDAGKADKTAKKTKLDPNSRTSPMVASAGGLDSKKSDRLHTVKDRETLGDIAQKYLGSSTRWKEIYKLNEGKYPDPARIRAGAQLKLPPNKASSSQSEPASDTSGQNGNSNSGA